MHLARVGHETRLWARDTTLVAEMRRSQANETYLAGVSFPPHLDVTSALDAALAGAELVVSAVPSHGTREIARTASSLIAPGTIVVSATRFGSPDILLRGLGVPEIHNKIHKEDSVEPDERTRDRDLDAVLHFGPPRNAFTPTDTMGCVFGKFTSGQ